MSTASAKTPILAISNSIFRCEITQKCWTSLTHTRVKLEIPDRRQQAYMSSFSCVQWEALSTFCGGTKKTAIDFLEKCIKYKLKFQIFIFWMKKTVWKENFDFLKSA